MLSIIDIKNELGKNIYLYPVHPESIKGNTIDMHASEFGWSLKTGRRLNSGNGYLEIPPHDIALIYTEESIYVSRKIGGTYHSKVTLVSKGLSHVSTTLDPQYLGTSLIAMCNYNDTSFSIRIGSEFVTLIFYYLSTPDYWDSISHDNDPGHPRMIENFERNSDYISWRDEHKWSVRKDILYEEMVNSSAYKICKENFALEQKTFNRKHFWGKIQKCIIPVLSMAVISGFLAISAYVFDCGVLSLLAKVIVENFAFPVLASVVVVQLSVDSKTKN